MEIHEVPLISGIAVLFFFAVKLFRENKANQKKLRHIEELRDREERKRLLNVLTDWATQIIQCGLDPDTAEAPGSRNLQDEETYNYNVETLTSTKQRLLAIRARTDYIRSVTSTFRQELKSAVRLTTGLLDQHVKLLDQFFEGEIDADQLGTYRYILNESAKHVIEEASKIKIADLHIN